MINSIKTLPIKAKKTPKLTYKMSNSDKSYQLTQLVKFLPDGQIMPSWSYFALSSSPPNCVTMGASLRLIDIVQKVPFFNGFWDTVNLVASGHK